MIKCGCRCVSTLVKYSRVTGQRRRKSPFAKLCPGSRGTSSFRRRLNACSGRPKRIDVGRRICRWCIKSRGCEAPYIRWRRVWNGCAEQLVASGVHLLAHLKCDHTFGDDGWLDNACVHVHPLTTDEQDADQYSETCSIRIVIIWGLGDLVWKLGIHCRAFVSNQYKLPSN